MYGPMMGGLLPVMRSKPGGPVGLPPGRTEQIPRPATGAMMGPAPQYQFPMMQGLGGRSQSLFDQYMQQAFMQRYRPQTPLGGYQNMGLFGGFMPQMTPRQMIGQQQPIQQPVMGPKDWGGDPNRYTDPNSPFNSPGA
jgi:hypothetical protein